ncbi:PepSY-associated TM helix domain-containing protein [Acinetobacter larvae]|uniref:Histidine kinase n=1 Tax=Acinetobacter larvae TaxID=1789224 RepID=A0A1B2LW79_9GAMM|nr:PepSY-associated TM helix domain-containing protein [Acinetobacter larvae]AOA57023.1 histidine kinase [Acinetobacter larvae]
MKVRTDIIKTAKDLHTWVGISAGILLFICFFAGGLTMFQHDLSRWASPPAQQLAPIQAEQYPILIQKVQAAYPETQQSFGINFSSKEHFNAPMQWTTGNAGRSFDSQQRTMLATLNPDGSIRVEEENVSKLGWLIEQLHETGGIPGTVGHHTLGVYVMGIVAVLYFLAIMSGLIILLPTLVKDFFAIRKGKNKKRFWLDTHNVIGITSLPFHILISITVIVFAFHDLFFVALGKIVYRGEALFKPAIVQIADPKPAFDLDTILTRIQQQAPEYEIRAITFNRLDQPEKASAFAALYSDNHMLRGDYFDYMSFNPYQSDAYNNQTLNAHNGAWDKLINSMFSLHFGNYGGDITRWLYVLLGIGGAFLFYSGNILWVESRIKKHKNMNLPAPAQRRDVKFIANLTVGACLGCVLAVFTSMLVGRWAYVFSPQLSNHNLLFMYAYYVVFCAALAYSFIFGAARVLPQLLVSIAIVLVLLPVSSLLAYILQINGLWYSTGQRIWVDVFAVIFALAFLRFYQQAYTRAKTASAGSLWAIQKSSQQSSEQS